METAAMAVVMGSICHGVNRRRPQLGVGDVWLVCALVGWMGGNGCTAGGVFWAEWFYVVAVDSPSGLSALWGSGPLAVCRVHTSHCGQVVPA